jgi:hypothetical protein
VTSPAFPPGPPPPPKKRRTWLIVLVSTGVVVVLCCGLGLGRLFFRLKHVSDIDKDVDQATAAFIADRRDGLSQAGYDGLCTQAQGDFRLQDLAAPQKDPSTSFRIIDTTVDYDRRQAVVSVEEKLADGVTEQRSYVLNEEGERWRMCVFPR